MLICDLLSYLFDRFPSVDAEGWDHVGLSVGDPQDEVRGVRVALDATLANVKKTADAGANVLLTHHPVYIKAPDRFSPFDSAVPSCSSAVYTAIQHRVNIISLHTNLDRSIEARELLPARVGLSPVSSLEFADSPQQKGLGSLCDGWHNSLEELARVCSERFETEPRVWGDGFTQPSRIAFLGGSLGDFGEYALERGAQAIVTGEAGYHVCQDLSLRGLAVILLGHDRSEEPFVEILRDACCDAGVAPDLVGTINGSRQWWTLQRN